MYRDTSWALTWEGFLEAPVDGGARAGLWAGTAWIFYLGVDMDSGTSKAKTVEFTYIMPREFRADSVSGCLGGVLPDGDIAVYFFFERPEPLHSQEFEVDEKGNLGREVGRQPSADRRKFERIVTSGVVVSVANAKVICDWLGQRVQEAEKRVGGAK